MLVLLLALVACIIGAALNIATLRASIIGGYAFAVGLWWVLEELAHHAVRLP